MQTVVFCVESLKVESILMKQDKQVSDVIVVSPSHYLFKKFIVLTLCLARERSSMLTENFKQNYNILLMHCLHTSSSQYESIAAAFCFFFFFEYTNIWMFGWRKQSDQYWFWELCVFESCMNGGSRQQHSYCVASTQP